MIAINTQMIAQKICIANNLLSLPVITSSIASIVHITAQNASRITVANDTFRLLFIFSLQQSLLYFYYNVILLSLLIKIKL